MKKKVIAYNKNGRQTEKEVDLMKKIAVITLAAAVVVACTMLVLKIRKM